VGGLAGSRWARLPIRGLRRRRILRPFSSCFFRVLASRCTEDGKQPNMQLTSTAGSTAAFLVGADNHTKGREPFLGCFFPSWYMNAKIPSRFRSPRLRIQTAATQEIYLRATRATTKSPAACRTGKSNRPSETPIWQRLDLHHRCGRIFVTCSSPFYHHHLLNAGAEIE